MTTDAPGDPGIRDILSHYASAAEAGRLRSGAGQLERARTEEILLRYLPTPPARVLDVGGGPGAYAVWLLEHGYDVDLIDVVPLHVEQANAAMARVSGGRGSARVGDARQLDVDDRSADAALLLGPLYHLTEWEERVRALREASRALRPGGVLIAAAISRFASLLDGYRQGFIRDSRFREIVDADLREGRHSNPTERTDWFTTAYFHDPSGLRDELADAGLQVVTVLAVEGPFWTVADFESHWADEASRAQLLAYLRRIEADESLLGASAHLLAIARKGAE